MDLEDHEHESDDPNQRPKWSQSTLEEVGDIFGDPVDPRRMRSQFKEVPHALIST
jgi:hypothetical protein